MKRKRHKRKNSYTMLVTSDAVDAGLTQLRIRPWLLRIAVVVICVIIGVTIGALIYETNEQVQQTSKDNLEIQELKTENQKLADQMEVLESEKDALENQAASQEETIQLLSDTVNQKTQSETELLAEREEQYLPTGLPLTGSATVDESTEGEPICVFTASDDAMIVATANGTVIAVNDDAEYGHNIWIDHGNGYITIYRNQGEVKVKQGKVVTRGTTLFLINEESNQLGYQMMQNNEYIDPMEMISFSG